MALVGVERILQLEQQLGTQGAEFPPPPGSPHFLRTILTIFACGAVPEKPPVVMNITG